MPTKIEWTDESWNPITGCTPISEGCQHCYARRMAHRLAGRYGYPEAPHEFDVTLHPDKLDQPFHWRKPRKIFVCSMGDLFHEDVPEDFIIKILDMISLSGPCYRNQTEDDPVGKFWPGHTFQILTKRPQRMKKVIERYYQRVDGEYPGDWSELLEWRREDYGHENPHLWLGITAENQRTADERIPWLLRTPAAVRFISAEPMLSRINLCQAQGLSIYVSGGGNSDLPLSTGIESNGLDWVICGGETGPGAREMKTEWAVDLYQQCKDAGVPFFFKKPGDAFQGNPADLPLDVRDWPEGFDHA